MDVNFERAEKIWSPLIGKFIVDFVVIDDSIQHIIGKHLSKLSQGELKNQHKLRIRLRSIKKIMMLYLVDAKMIQQFNEVILEIKDLYQIRNLIAHNSLSFRYDLHENGSLKAVGFQINGKKIDLSLDYEELKAKLEHLRDVRTRFSQLTQCYYESEIRLIEQLANSKNEKTQIP